MAGLHSTVPVKTGFVTVCRTFFEMFIFLGCRTASYLQELSVQSKVTSNVITDLTSDVNKGSLLSILTLQTAMEVKGKVGGCGQSPGSQTPVAMVPWYYV